MNQPTPLRIDNSGFAQSNILFGRVLPACVTIGAIWWLVSLLSKGYTRGAVVPALLSSLLIVYMIVAFVRRGRHAAVKSIEFQPDHIDVVFAGSTSSFDITQIRAMEYAGTQNPARVSVRNARFPNDRDWILVLTLADGTELRVVVGHEYDAPLKEIAARL